jgi:hypothetical protein
MTRIAAVAALAMSLTIGAVLYFRAPGNPPAALEQARLEQLSRLIDRLERVLAANTDIRSGADSSSASPVGGCVSIRPPAEVLTTPAASEALANRDAASRAGNAVVERALQSARWTRQDAIELNVATAALSGSEQAEIHARLAAAINDDRLQVDPAALGL